MIRGIRFVLPNKKYPINYLLRGIEIEKYLWVIAEEEVISNEGKSDFFGKAIYSGAEFLNVSTDESCLVIFLNLQAYLNEEDISNIKTYKDLQESKCKFILLVDDCVFVDIYSSDKELISAFKRSAKNSGFTNIEYITEDNDKYETFELF